MKNRKIFLALLSLILIIMVFPVTSCAEKDPTTREDMQALLRDSATQMETTKNIRTVNTGSFSLEIPQMVEEMGLDFGNITGELNLNTAHNTDKQETEMKLDASVDLGGSMTMKVIVEYWYVDGWHYFHFSIPFAGDKWGKTNKSMEGIQKITDSYDAIVEIFLNSLEMEYIGKENIDGNTSYHISIKPTDESIKNIFEWIAEKFDVSDDDLNETLENEAFNTVMNKLIDGLKLEIWIDKGTKLVSQLKFSLNAEFTPADFEMEESDSGNIKISFDITLNAKAQEETISITPPAEALNAEEVDPEDLGSIFN